MSVSGDVLRITQISPVSSEVIKSLPWPSTARPVGLKHASGHAETSGLLIMSTAAVVLFGGSTGIPLANSTTESLYPIGMSRFLHLSMSVVRGMTE